MYHRIFVALVVAAAVGCAAPVKGPVAQPEPEAKAKTDPPGAPLEAKLVVK
jgi:hypothetical protein